jgi:hypothetical protein
VSKLEDIADGLAKRALDLVEKTGNETIERRTADEIGSLSPTLQEAYTTAVRIRKAELRASRLLDKYEAGETVGKAAISSQPQD